MALMEFRFLVKMENGIESEVAIWKNSMKEALEFLKEKEYVVLKYFDVFGEVYDFNDMK